MNQSDFSESGFAYIPGIVLDSQLATIEEELAEIEGAGSRRMLDHRWVCELAGSLMSSPLFGNLLDEKIAVQCTYFDKSPGNNWLVPTHQDKFVPVRRKFDSKGWTSWTQKEEIDFVSPPRRILEECVALRLHIDDSTAENGLMELCPGSHNSSQRENTIAVEAEAGSVLLFRPLLFHRSSKAQKGRRRVLQFLFGPTELPDGAEWFYKIYRNVS